METTLSVKVCGIGDPGSARAALEAGADRLGLVFARSPRRVGLETAAALVELVPAAWVGVFVDAEADAIARTADRLDLHAIQLHGDESPHACAAIRERTGRAVWKAIRWNADRERVEAWGEVVDALLVDASDRERFGGTGRTVPWEALSERLPPGRRPVPLILAGGLGPDNVARAIEIVAPEGVDASSRLERAPGEKDPDLVRAFVAAARDAVEAHGGSR